MTLTSQGIRMLARYAFASGNVQTSQEALRCLANALLLEPATRQRLVDLGFADKAADRLKSDSADDEFLTARILFLMTYETDLDYDRLVHHHHLADTINVALARHAKQYSKSTRRMSLLQAAPVNSMALSETLKLLFNITHFYPDLSEHFSKAIPHIFKILVRNRIPSPPLQAPVNYLVNALINLDLEDRKGQQLKFLGGNAVFPKFDQKCNAEHLINILDNAIVAYSEAELDTSISPVLTLIRRVYEIAPDGVKKYMEWLLLPTDEERSRPLGRSDTLSSRLLRLSTSAMTPGLRGSISSMMFELSGKDAAQFVHNVGYGFAAGFLISNNITMPENAAEACATADEKAQPALVNPITGQRLAMEDPTDATPMTQEEKEHEAERLFVLFERCVCFAVSPCARAPADVPCFFPASRPPASATSRTPSTPRTAPAASTRSTTTTTTTRARPPRSAGSPRALGAAVSCCAPPCRGSPRPSAALPPPRYLPSPPPPFSFPFWTRPRVHKTRFSRQRARGALPQRGRVGREPCGAPRGPSALRTLGGPSIYLAPLWRWALARRGGVLGSASRFYSQTHTSCCAHTRLRCPMSHVPSPCAPTPLVLRFSRRTPRLLLCFSLHRWPPCPRH